MFFCVTGTPHLSLLLLLHMEAHVYDKLQLAHEEPDFEGPYRSIVGGLLFLFVSTRVDIGFALSILSQHLSNPKPTHFMLAK